MASLKNVYFITYSYKLAWPGLKTCWVGRRRSRSDESVFEQSYGKAEESMNPIFGPHDFIAQLLMTFD